MQCLMLHGMNDNSGDLEQGDENGWDREVAGCEGEVLSCQSTRSHMSGAEDPSVTAGRVQTGGPAFWLRTISRTARCA